MIYQLSHSARSQIEEIIRYTDDNFGPLQTDDYVGGLINSFELLADNPQMGRVFAGTRRRYIYRGHHIYYTVRAESVLILDIRNARQEPPGI